MNGGKKVLPFREKHDRVTSCEYTFAETDVSCNPQATGSVTFTVYLFYTFK